MEGRPVLWIFLLMICLPHLLGLEGLAEDILKEVNELREEVGLPPLKLDERLSGKAYEYLNAFLNGNTPQIVYNCALLMITLPKNHTFSSRFVAGLLLRKGAGSARFKTAGLAVVTTHDSVLIGLLLCERDFATQHIFNGTTTPSDLERSVFELVNELRVKYGLSPLRWHEGLASVARAHSEDMGKRGYFGHIDPEGRDPWDRVRGAGIGCTAVAENVFKAEGVPLEGVEAMARMVVRGWASSPGHLRNMLGKWTHTGVGVYVGNGTVYVTQVFCEITED